MSCGTLVPTSFLPGAPLLQSFSDHGIFTRARASHAAASVHHSWSAEGTRRSIAAERHPDRTMTGRRGFDAINSDDLSGLA
jgi:hypothetical protein